MVYCADQPATALLQTLAHARRADLLTAAYVVFEVELDPDVHLLRFPREDLPADWQMWPWPEATQELGTYWYDQAASLALEVPSAVVPRQRNYLLNAQHADFTSADVRGPEAFPVDLRLVGTETPEE
jgi:RES domain-containing protein